MRDPIEELENFTVPGPPMNPLPAAEVRRRGNRIRRRNNVLAGAAAVAVLAAVLTPVALLADNDQDRDVQPAPAVEWRQTVPDDFPLNHDLFGDPPVTARSGVDDIVLCGATAWSPDSPAATVDIAGARFEENEAFLGRTLALYADEDAAAQALTALRSGVEDCPRDENGTGLPLIQETVPVDLGADGFAFIQRSKDGALLAELTLWEVVRSGNALYLDTSYGAAGDDQAVTTAISNMTHRSEVVRAQLCVFSADPCATPGIESESPGIGAGAVSAIPSGLQLGRGLSSAEGEPVDGPSATAEGVPALDLCGTAVWPVTGVERLAVTVSGPEYRESRELVTFASSAELTSTLDALRPSAAAGCAPDGRVLTPYDATVGDDSVTFALTYQDGLGLDIYQFVRVGRALLATHRMTEGSLASAEQSVPDVTDANAGLVPDLCPFTERGC